MPRQARKKSSSGIYHIMLRGINRQQVFEDNEDRGQGDGSLVPLLLTAEYACDNIEMGDTIG